MPGEIGKKEDAYVYRHHPAVHRVPCLDVCCHNEGLEQGRVPEWDGPKAQGAADGEFGPLLVEIPKKSGGDAARFYERGLTVGGKRVAYAELKDAAFIPGSGGGITPAQKMRNSSVLWLYRKKGSTIGIRDMSYRFDRQTMEAIQTGLGFRPQA